METPFLFLALKEARTFQKKKIILKQHGLKSSFKTQQEYTEFLHRLRWCYDLPWRQEQSDCLQTFCTKEWNELIVQAIFGGGKTTMMLAMIQHLVLQGLTHGLGVQVCAFNVCIKNEIKKKLRFVAPKVKIQTFDSLIYQLCKELEYEHLKTLDFTGKRKFIQRNLSKIESDPNIQILFVDEAQDLEKTAYDIFRKRFPHAKKVFVGDVFQSIQKEPRESMLWYFLRREEDPLIKRYSMTDTPRVPHPVLKEIQTALSTFYPEFSETIQKWTSSSSIETTKPIEWHPFDSYKSVYEEMKNFIEEKGINHVMILTFSSAITVRGVLGDVSRVRQFLIEKDIPVNRNHKQMKDDCVFLSTANSSKGLERDYVFAFLTFPLELAFANFSDDLVVNLTTVALSRCKKGVVMYIPKSKDRFSSVLNLYKKCPAPVIQEKIFVSTKKPTVDTLYEDHRDQKRRMLEKEQSITETLRLSILSFATKSLLKSYAKKYRTVSLPQHEMKQISMSEEDSTFSGVVFETLTLGVWKNQWPKNPATMGTFQHHDVFQSFHKNIAKMRSSFLAFQQRHPVFANLSVENQVEGAVSYARLHLACFQKIFWRNNPALVEKIKHHWQNIKNILYTLRPREDQLSCLKIQQNVAMPFLTGIADAILIPPSSSKDLLEIFEIKASKSPDWQENAFLQSLLYGLCMGRSFFRIHLVNVYHKEVQSYIVQFKESFEKVRDAVMTDLRLWNLNCFLSKNVSHHDKTKKTMNLRGTFFLDGNQEKKSWCLSEIVSPTKTFLHPLDDEQAEETLVQLVNDFQIQKIVVSRRLSKEFIYTRFPDLKSTFRFLRYTQPCFTEKGSWQFFLQSIGWYNETTKEDDTKKTFLEWENPQCSFMLQWALLCTQYNFDV